MSNPLTRFKRIILLSPSERLDVQFIPKANQKTFPCGFKYSFNYRAFIQGRWVPLVRWDNSHQGCHIDLLVTKVKLVDEKRSTMRSFQALSSSIVDELGQIRSAVRSALEREDIRNIDSLLKDLMKI